jgi:hypothetical protein
MKSLAHHLWMMVGILKHQQNNLVQFFCFFCFWIVRHGPNLSHSPILFLYGDLTYFFSHFVILLYQMFNRVLGGGGGLDVFPMHSNIYCESHISQQVQTWFGRVSLIAEERYYSLYHLGLFWHFETVTNIRTWIESHRYWRIL